MCTRVRTCRCCLGAGRCVGGGGQLGTRVLPGVGCPQATPDHHSTLSLSNLGLQLKKLSIFIAIKLFLCAQLGGLQGSWSEFPEQHQGAVCATPPQGSNAEKSRPPGTGCKGPRGGGGLGGPLSPGPCMSLQKEALLSALSPSSGRAQHPLQPPGLGPGWEIRRCPELDLLCRSAAIIVQGGISTLL